MRFHGLWRTAVMLVGAVAFFLSAAGLRASGVAIEDLGCPYEPSCIDLENIEMGTATAEFTPSGEDENQLMGYGYVQYKWEWNAPDGTIVWQDPAVKEWNRGQDWSDSRVKFTSPGHKEVSVTVWARVKNDYSGYEGSAVTATGTTEALQIKPDLDPAGMSESNEEINSEKDRYGLFLLLNEVDESPDDDLAKITLREVLPNDLSGTVTLLMEGDGSRIKLWETENMDNEIALGWQGKDYDTPDTAEPPEEEPDGILDEFYVEGCHKSKSMGDVSLVVEYLYQVNPYEQLLCTDHIEITVVDLDLSATDLQGGVSEAEEEDPGAYVHYNLDDDNRNNTPDNDEVGPITHPEHQENDLKAAFVSLNATSENPCPLYAGTVKLTRQNDKTQVWTHPAKGTDEELLVGQDEKTWNLTTARQDFIDVRDDLYVEGEGAPESTPNSERSSYLKVTYTDPYGNLIFEDEVWYTYVAAACAYGGEFNGQPTPARRDFLLGKHPQLVGCEWGLLPAPAPLADFNCFGWTIYDEDDEDLRWVYPWDIDDAGDGDNVLENSDVEAFYSLEEGLYPLEQGTDEEKADQAVVMYYAYDDPWDFEKDDLPSGPGGHAARRRNCFCGAGLWIMYSSKSGEHELIEHRWDQLNCPGYGEPDVFYW